MDKGEIKYDLLKTELELTQRQMDKYDTLGTTTKTWAVTLWAASIGWAFQVHRGDIFLVSVAIVLVFWFFDAMNKAFRSDYKKRRDEVAGALAVFFEKGEVPAGTVSPQLPAHDFLMGPFRNFFILHTALPYIILIVISILLFVNGGIS